MQNKFLGNASNNYNTSRTLNRPPTRPSSLLRLPTNLPSAFAPLGQNQTSSSLAILEAVPRLASLSLDAPGTAAQEVPPSLIRGFKATIPSSEIAKQRRRLIRGGLVDEDLGFEKIGLKKLGDRARGLLTEVEEGDEESELGVGRKHKKRRRDRQGRNRSNSLQGKLHLEDLVQQADEISQDKENLHVRTVSSPASPF